MKQMPMREFQRVIAGAAIVSCVIILYSLRVNALAFAVIVFILNTFYWLFIIWLYRVYDTP